MKVAGEETLAAKEEGREAKREAKELKESEKKRKERWHEVQEERLKQAMSQFAQKGPGRRETPL